MALLEMLCHGGGGGELALLCLELANQNLSSQSVITQAPCLCHASRYDDSPFGVLPLCFLEIAYPNKRKVAKTVCVLKTFYVGLIHSYILPLV